MSHLLFEAASSNVNILFIDCYDCTPCDSPPGNWNRDRPAGGCNPKKERSRAATLGLLVFTILAASGVRFFFNNVVMPRPVLNFMLIGMAFSVTFSNMVSEERLEQIMSSFNPILGVSMVIVIINLGAPLDYHLVFGAGLFTTVYILARAAGKYFGAYFGAKLTKSPDTTKKFLKLTLLPHSGVSPVFTAATFLFTSGRKQAWEFRTISIAKKYGSPIYVFPFDTYRG